MTTESPVQGSHAEKFDVYLIDATYELFRAFYGGPKATSKEGRPVGAGRTLARSLVSLLRDARVTHVACAFDHVIESFRNELFAGYKTGEGIDPELLAQFELGERVSEALGMTTWKMIEFEADDALATGAHICEQDPRVRQVLICSPDKDLAQCVREDRVVLFDRMRRLRWSERDIEARFGVKPSAIPDYLALVGDSADGFPGLAGFGAKSAALLLSAYATLEAIPEDASAWAVRPRGGPKLADELRRQREQARLYRTLATLRRDVPLGVTVDDLAWRGPDQEKLLVLSQELSDPEIVARVNEVWRTRTIDAASGRTGEG